MAQWTIYYQIVIISHWKGHNESSAILGKFFSILKYRKFAITFLNPVLWIGIVLMLIRIRIWLSILCQTRSGSDPTQSLTHVGNVKKSLFYSLYLQQCQFTERSFEKKYTVVFSLHLADMDTDPDLDLQALDVDPARSGSTTSLEPLP